jgi:hypothetical protein
MFHKLKTFALLVTFALLTLWTVVGTFNYFTQSTPPEISVLGLEKEGSYNKTTDWIIKSTGSYKVSELTVMLDGKEYDFGVSKRVGAKKFEIPLRIDTLVLTDGAHKLEIKAVDSSYQQNKFEDSWNFNVDNTPLHAAFIDPEYTVWQGKTIHMKIQANKQLERATLKLFSETYHFTPESDNSTLYECFVPIDCEEKTGDFLVNAELEDPVKNSTKLSCKIQIKPFQFKKQNGFSVSSGKLSEEKEISINTKMLKEALDRWLTQSPRKKLWSGAFEFPIESPKITTPHGEIRMTPERGRYMHKGIDLCLRPKCVVWAAQNGTVIIKDRFHMTGNTVVMDHGLGVFTLYAHLEDFADINIGDSLKKGNPLGRLGMTGYASGYHLHWELRVNNIPVDPLEWISKIF